MSFTAGKIFSLGILAAFAILGRFSTAQAVTFAPGDSAALNGTTLPSGEILAQSTQAVSFSSLTSTVLRDASTGKLDFIYSFNAPAQGGGTLTLTLGGLDGFTTDVDYIGPSVNSGLIPAAKRTSASLIFNEDLGEGDLPPFPLLVKTDATQYTTSAPLTVDAFVESAPGVGPGKPPSVLQVYGPASEQTGAVPELTTFSSTTIGFVLWLLRGSRKLR